MYTGLSEVESSRRYQRYGPNTIMTTKKISPLAIFFSQFKDMMVMVLLGAIAVSAFMGDMTEAIAIISIVIINATLGFVQEYKTEKTMETLKNMAAPTAKVIREGRFYTLQAHLLVPGDLIILEAGDRIPADAELIEANNLKVNESLLTGESLPVDKLAKTGDKTCKVNLLYMGTSIVNGRAKAFVNATGMSTEMGEIASMIEDASSEDTPLQKKLHHLGKFIVYGCLVICTIVAATGFLRGEPLFSMLLSGISLAVAAVPEGLPAIVTIALALGVQRMLKKNALVRKLTAVETLGCSTIICSDKTGTLTLNKMVVKEIYSESTKKTEPSPFTIAGCCNNASMDNEEASDPTETALLNAARDGGATRESLENTYKRIAELPFDSDRKCMSVVCEDLSGRRMVFTKGAPDVLLKKCQKILTDEGVKDISSEMGKITKAIDKMAGSALRVIALAYKRIGRTEKHDQSIENELVFVGLMGMLDPPKPEAAEAVKKCRTAGIKPVKITGDHKLTAVSIAQELDIYRKGDKILTGADIDSLGEKELEKIAGSVSVYARVSPRHKLLIVKALKKLGHVVAMTGDGVNDAPAVKEADIGVSMGRAGTDVTKEASAMMLLDDNFKTIVSAVEEGRVIYDNIRKFIRYMLACNIGEVLTMFIGTLIGLPIPLTPIQILWVNLVTDGLPAVALGFDPPDPNCMNRPPRGQNESIFSNGLLFLIILRGILIGGCTLGVFASMLYLGGNLATARTGAFVILMLTQLMHVFECKSETKNIFEIPLLNNLSLVLSVIASIGLVLGVVYIPVAQEIFKTEALALGDWVLITGFSLLGPVLASFFKGNSKGKKFIV